MSYQSSLTLLVTPVIVMLLSQQNVMFWFLLLLLLIWSFSQWVTLDTHVNIGEVSSCCLSDVVHSLKRCVTSDMGLVWKSQSENVTVEQRNAANRTFLFKHCCQQIVTPVHQGQQNEFATYCCGLGGLLCNVCMCACVCVCELDKYLTDLENVYFHKKGKKRHQQTEEYQILLSKNFRNVFCKLMSSDFS